jgi:HEAT repeat protein
MPSRKTWLAGLAIIALGVPSLRAQVPSLPASPGVGVPAGGTAGAASGLGSSGSAIPSSTPSTGFCANLATFCQNCRAKLCASQFGQMLGSLATGPMASVTGGFLPSICPPPGTIPPGGLGSPAGSAASTAAAIQASEANAKARVAAIEYLGTVDCARWPEAQKALINGLRQDPNECVRFAAARALNSGCCCDKKVIDALRICVAGETSDGAPAENSVRVKAAAFSALQNCLMRVPEDLPPETVPPVPEGERPQLTPLPPTPERRTQAPVANPHMATAYNPPRRGPITYDEKLRHKTFSQTVDEARRTLFQVSKTPRPPATLPAGQRSLFGALARARNEVGGANLRRAREQGLVPPRPDQSRGPIMPEPAQVPSGAGVEPGAATPAPIADPGLMPTATPGSGPGAAGTAPAAEPVPERVVEEPGTMSNADPAPTPRSSARRGLIGMLFQPRGD